MEAGGGADALTVQQRLPDRLSTVVSHRLTTALLGRAPQAAHDPLSDHGSLVGTEHRQHLEHHGAGRRRGVEALRVDVEVHALGLDVAEEMDQVGQTSPDPTNRKTGDLIEIFAGDSLEQVVEAGPFVAALGTGDAFIDEGGDHLPILPLGDGQQITKLVFDGLVFVSRAHTTVDRHALGQERSPIAVRGTSGSHGSTMRQQHRGAGNVD